MPDGRIVVGGMEDNAPFLGTVDSIGNNQLWVDGVPVGPVQPSGLGFSMPGAGLTRTTVSGLAMQPDGKILALLQGAQTVVARYNTDGSLDTSFGTGGVAPTDLNVAYIADGPVPPGSGLAIQPDGNILVAGSSDRQPTSSDNAYYDMALARLAPDGSRDPGFNGGLTAFLDVPIPYGWFVTGTALQPDGKALVVGVADIPDARLVLLRYNRDGTPDLTFGTAGQASVPSSYRGWDPFSSLAPTDPVAVQPDGKILVEQSDNGPEGLSFDVYRFDADGSLDPTFGQGGIASMAMPGIVDGVFPGMALQADGKIVLAGWWSGPADDYTPDFTLMRYNADGSLDTSFGGGVVSTPLSTDPGPDYAQDVRVQADGRIVVVGYGSHTTATGDYCSSVDLARYLPDGSLDPSFGNGGIVLDSFPGNSQSDQGYQALAIQPDGKLVAGGWDWDGAYEFALRRYNPDGSPDLSFGTGGKAAAAFPQGSSWNRVAVEPDGRIVISGTDDPGRLALVRFDADGSLDTTFGVGGLATAEFGPETEIAQGLAVQADGNFLIAGAVGGKLALVRFTGGDLLLSGMSQQQVSRQLQALEQTVSQPGQTTSISFQAADNTQLSELINAANRYDATNDPYGLPSAPVGTMTITVNLASGSYGGQTINLPANVTLIINSAAGATPDPETVNGGSIVVSAGVSPANWTVNGGDVTVQGSATAGDFTVNGGRVTLADGTIIGNSPALTVNGGEVILLGMTLTTDTDSPTIVVNGGSLVVRNSTIEESTGYAQTALQVNGGTVDLGTATDPGNNVINVNGAGARSRTRGRFPYQRSAPRSRLAACRSPHRAFPASCSTTSTTTARSTSVSRESPR